jgi:hypothetical protein
MKDAFVTTSDEVVIEQVVDWQNCSVDGLLQGIHEKAKEARVLMDLYQLDNKSAARIQSAPV